MCRIGICYSSWSTNIFKSDIKKLTYMNEYSQNYSELTLHTFASLWTADEWWNLLRMAYFFCSYTIIYRRVQNVSLVNTDQFHDWEHFLSLWNFRDRRGINPLNSINILAWEQFRSGKRLLEVTILYSCVHVILWTFNNETHCSALFCDLVRHFWLGNHDSTIWQTEWFVFWIVPYQWKSSSIHSLSEFTL